MTSFSRILFTAVLAVTAENLIFTGGIGFSRVLRAARKPKTMGLYALFVGLFSLISALLYSLLSPRLVGNSTIRFLRPTVYALCAAAVYLIASYLLKSFLPSFYKRTAEFLAPSAINSIVLSMPYSMRMMSMDVIQAVGFALGTGVSFFLASLIMARAFRLCRHQDMPKAFEGLPAVFVYVGILSMAFVGFSGGGLL